MSSSSTSTQAPKKLHFLMIPLMCQGHLIPVVDIARLLTKRPHVKATIVTTPLNALRFNSIVDRAARAGLDIRVLTLPFPHAEAGLPEGAESIDTLPSPSYVKNFMQALALLQRPLEEKLALGELGDPAPSCIISDKHVVWTAETSARFGLARVLFDGMGCFALMCFNYLFVSKAHERVSDEFLEKVSIPVPGRPDPVKIPRAQMPRNLKPGSDRDMDEWRRKVREGEERAYGFLVNSFDELEREYVKEYRKTTRQKVWCVGPVSFCNEDELDKAERGRGGTGGGGNGNDKILKWLDTWGPRSVVYACLGSLNRVTPRQVMELGSGLEGSKRPFILVIRGGYKMEEIEAWLKEDGFEERNKGRGILIKGWAPQVLILSHRSIGAFLTHCGWNSTLEGVSCGVPMLTWPLFAEQFFNEKLIVQVLEIGVSVGAKMVVNLGEEESFCDEQFLVKRSSVEEAIEKVMGEGKESQERRERIKKLASASKKAIQKGGSSYQNITLLLEDVTLHMKLDH